MECHYFPLFTLRILAILNIVFSVQCQICKLEYGVLPESWNCDGEPHIVSKDRKQINRYCGYNISPTLPQKTTEKVSNGRAALLGELPFVASIAYKGRHVCGASLIDNYHLVTAAHCVLLVKYVDPNGNGIDPAKMKVQMGTTFRYGTHAAENDTNSITRNVREIHRHPDYEQGYIDRDTRKNKKGGYGGSDIAIIVLADPMPFTRNIWPTCLGSKDLVPATANQRTNPLILSGFGQDKNRDVINVKLQVSKQIRLLEEDKCETSIKDLGYEFKQGQVCTVGIQEEKTAGACKGDSGGPLSQALRGRYYLLGVVSYGPGDCVKGSTKNPDVYTDVRYFKTWIDGTTTKWRYSTYFERKCKKDNVVCQHLPCSPALAEHLCPVKCKSDLPENHLCLAKEECKGDNVACQHLTCTRALAEHLCPVQCQSDLPGNHPCAAKEDEPTSLLTTTQETLITTAESPVCSSAYQNLTDPWRKIDRTSPYTGRDKSDCGTPAFDGTTWFRFLSPVGTKLSTVDVKGANNPKICGAHVVSWMKGDHPTTHGKVVNRQILWSYQGHENYLNYKTEIKVVACHGQNNDMFYLYQLKRALQCNFGYCAI